MRGHLWQRGFCALFTACLGASAAQAETCGIDSIFVDDFESATFVPIGQVRGTVSSPGLIADIIGSGTLTVAIGSPTGSPTTGEKTVDVVGTFAGPINTGITANGVAGFVANGQFVIPDVPLSSGSNIITVEATTIPGALASASTSIPQGGLPSPVSLTTDRAIGYAPLEVTFHYNVGVLPGAATVQSISINFRGTGPDDYVGPLSGAPTTYTYSQIGVYTAHFALTDSNSQVYGVYSTVAVQDLAVQRGMVCDIYGYLKDRLSAQDSTGASNAFQPAIRSEYATFFNQLATNMPATASQLGVVVNGQFGMGFADLLLVRDNVSQTRSGFPVRLTQGADGVWRISEM
jgi:Glucodextranase, domain B